ncbi:MAG: hypothetical protein GEU78_11390 [Actinobacteria bacterium]|nr:hypothetical protein [Actinomycetota bacterium]
MARTNLHELANRLLARLRDSSENNVFDGKLRQVAADAGLNSVRSAEAVKLLEDLGRIEVIQRGRRGRNTMIEIRSTEEITLADAESALPSRAAKRTSRLNYDEIGKAVVDRLLELARDDGLRAAQVEAFASETGGLRERIGSLEQALEAAQERETELRIKLRAAEEALSRAEENLRRAFASSRPAGGSSGQEPAPVAIEDADAKALLDILRTPRP